MIASIRVLNEGNFDYLCELDIMKHSQEQIVARLKELGIDKGNFFVCGISDMFLSKRLFQPIINFVLKMK